MRRLSSGDSTAEQELLPLVYKELRRRAGFFMRRERPGHTLQPSDLVHEAYLRFAGQDSMDWKCRAHFFAVASSTMRQILVDHARKHTAAKRGAGSSRRVAFEEGLAVSEDNLDGLIVLDQALHRLALQDERQAKIVEMRFFGGLTEEEIALILSVAERTVRRDWAVAKAWLKAELDKPAP